MKETKIILGVPQVTVNQQKWIYDLPATRMVNKKTGQYPEFTCDHAVIPSCTTRWSDIITAVPEFYMERHETILGVPEFAVKNQEIIMGIPEIRMERQRIVIGLPQITVKNVTVEQEKIQKESSAFQKKAQTESQALSASMKSEIKAKTTEKMHGVFQCQRRELDNKRADSLNQVDVQIQAAKAQADAARAAKADAGAKSADAVIVQLVATRAAIAAKYDEVAAAMTESEQKAVDEMNRPAGTKT